MRLRCTQCLSEIAERIGYETPSGEALCGPCYFALWGPKGSRTLSAQSETARPRSRRPRGLRGFWMPGPSGETDPSPVWRRRHR